MSKKRFSKKTLTMIVSILAVVAIAAGGVLAVLIDNTTNVKNIFVTSKVTTEVNETITDNVKTDVSIKNTGDILAFLRAEVIITWKNDAGEVYGISPVKGIDYEVSYNTNGWFEKDGFYYWKTPVGAGNDTGVLINSITPEGSAPEGYYLNVEIIGSGVQAEGMKEGAPENKNQPAEIAWGVIVNNVNGEAESISVE